MPHRTLIIGIGSPWGADRAGWAAAERLRAHPRVVQAGAEVVVLDRPGARLMDVWRPSDRVILIDAARTGAAAGTVSRWQGAQLEAGASAWSTHAFGVAEAVALARVLGDLPARLVIYGIEVGDGAEDAAINSRAIDGLIEQVLIELEEIARASSES